MYDQHRKQRVAFKKLWQLTLVLSPISGDQSNHCHCPAGRRSVV